ncbi:MAG TPA: M67 family metallopeptidase [Anaerolineae bacterium]|nr:M67 family metallopeptidase [Anaerolineae bacterium]
MQIERKHLSEMISHARDEAPREACGILAGRNGRVLRIYRTRNASRSPTSYSLGPDQQFRVFKDIENRGLELLGIYHSHPSSPATPSDRDVEQAYYPEVSYILISVADPAEAQVRAFRITAEGVAEEDLVVI